MPAVFTHSTIIQKALSWGLFLRAPALWVYTYASPLHLPTAKWCTRLILDPSVVTGSSGYTAQL